jgi:hypothetical protein
MEFNLLSTAEANMGGIPSGRVMVVHYNDDHDEDIAEARYRDNPIMSR